MSEQTARTRGVGDNLLPTPTWKTLSIPEKVLTSTYFNHVNTDFAQVTQLAESDDMPVVDWPYNYAQVNLHPFYTHGTDVVNFYFLGVKYDKLRDGLLTDYLYPYTANAFCFKSVGNNWETIVNNSRLLTNWNMNSYAQVNTTNMNGVEGFKWFVASREFGFFNFEYNYETLEKCKLFTVNNHTYVALDCNEDGVYTFPVEGGEMSKAVDVDGQTEVMDGIYFYSWVPSVDDDWTLTWNGSDKLPDWLHIELEDLDGNDDNGWDVYAGVSADPLPESMDYREATIRFEIPGDYIDYKFMQGEKTDPYIVPEPIVFFNTIIDLILHGGYDVRYDVDHDGAINIADLNLAIFQLID
jgi:hypothetical protein